MVILSGYFVLCRIYLSYLMVLIITYNLDLTPVINAFLVIMQCLEHPLIGFLSDHDLISVLLCYLSERDDYFLVLLLSVW